MKDPGALAGGTARTVDLLLRQRRVKGACPVQPLGPGNDVRGVRRKGFFLIGGSLLLGGAYRRIVQPGLLHWGLGRSGSYDKAHLFPCLTNPCFSRPAWAPFFRPHGYPVGDRDLLRHKVSEFVRSPALAGAEPTRSRPNGPRRAIDTGRPSSGRGNRKPGLRIGCNRSGEGGGQVPGGRSLASGPTVPRSPAVPTRGR